MKEWGGSRTGSGRKKLSDEKKIKGYTVQLSDEEIQYIDSQTGQSRSQKLRSIINEHKYLKK